MPTPRSRSAISSRSWWIELLLTSPASDCVKTCASRECAELFSPLPPFDCDCQRCSFPIQRNRDKNSTCKFDVRVFTQPRPNPDVHCSGNGWFGLFSRHQIESPIAHSGYTIRTISRQRMGAPETESSVHSRPLRGCPPCSETCSENSFPRSKMPGRLRTLSSTRFENLSLCSIRIFVSLPRADLSI